MNMEEILTLEGVLSLQQRLDSFLVDSPPWPEGRLNNISELATNLDSHTLVQQAEQILAMYSEVQDMLHKRQETLHRSEDRLKVSNSQHIRTRTVGVGVGGLGVGEYEGGGGGGLPFFVFFLKRS